MDKLAAETPRQIANAHTIFNVGIAFLFLPMAGLFARFCEWIVPDRPMEEGVIAKPRFLDDALIDTPSLALERVRLEFGHLGELVKQMLLQMMPVLLSGSRDDLKELAKKDDEVDILHHRIIDYLGQISRQRLSEEQTHVFAGYMEAVNDLENIGDIIETDLVTLGLKRIDANVEVSDQTRAVLEELHMRVFQAVEASIEALVESDQPAAQEVVALKQEIGRLMDAAGEHQMQRLVADEPNRLVNYALEVDVIEKLKRIYYFSKRVAKVVAPPEIGRDSA